MEDGAGMDAVVVDVADVAACDVVWAAATVVSVASVVSVVCAAVWDFIAYDILSKQTRKIRKIFGMWGERDIQPGNCDSRADRLDKNLYIC